MTARIVIDGIPELREGLRRIGGRDLEKQMGQVHKRIGGIIIDEAGGASTGVGRGRGERIRPSASVREVQLRVGGSHRSRRVQQWGIKPVHPHPSRPYIIEGANRRVGDIEREYTDGIQQVIDGALSG